VFTFLAGDAQEVRPGLRAGAVRENWVLPELIEAAVRTGRTDLAEDALTRLAVKAQVSGTDWALGVEARCRALLREGDQADAGFREAIDRLSRTRVRAELARAHLLYGEWLRREQRGRGARAELRMAHDMLDAMGMEAFAERARRELLATGETVRNRSVETASVLPRRRRTSPGSRERGGPIPRSAPSCSCRPAPSNGICARYSPSSASPHAVSSARR
jgi:hypothetical protein